MKERWDIYWNGTSGAKELIWGLLTMWRHLLPACGEFAEAIVPFLTTLARVFLIIALPFIFWLAPVIAIFSAHRIVSEEEVRHRLRAGIHKNGSIWEDEAP